MDAKWLSELLQATGPKSLALALAGGIVYVGWLKGWPLFDELPSWSTGGAVAALVIFGCLAGVSFFGVLGQQIASAYRAAFRWWCRRKARARFLSSIDEQLDAVAREEWVILAYLVTNDRQFFTGQLDGGNAATLDGNPRCIRADCQCEDLTPCDRFIVERAAILRRRDGAKS